MSASLIAHMLADEEVVVLEAPSSTATEFPAEVWDICSAEPFQRSSTRRAIQSDHSIGPAHARPKDPRRVRRWRVFVVGDLEVTLWVARQIWTRTYRGVLPLTLPASVHREPDGVDIEVVIEDVDLLRRFATAGGGDFEITLREWRG